MKTTVNFENVMELVLYAENTREVYFRHIVPAVENLKKKHQKGIFDVEKASKLFEYVATAAAKQYVKEFCTSDTKYYQVFPATDRRQAAKELLSSFMDEIGA